MHGAILSLLEFFEIVYKMKMNSVCTASPSDVDDEQMFFVPSLLSVFNGVAHISVQYWQQIEARYADCTGSC